MAPTLKLWTHVVGGIGVFIVFADHLPVFVKALGWVCLTFYALAWWAYLDEKLKWERHRNP